MLLFILFDYVFFKSSIFFIKFSKENQDLLNPKIIYDTLDLIFSYLLKGFKR